MACIGGQAVNQGKTTEHQEHRLLNALKWVLMWVAIAMAVCAGVYVIEGRELALEFLGGYLIELSLSMDNLFVFMSICTAFGIAEYARHRVLHWGIIGAVFLRLGFILLGVAIVSRFAWVLYIFGVLLLINGFKMFKGEEEEKDVRKSLIMRAIRKVMPMTDHFVGEKFVVKEKAFHSNRLVWHSTPLLGILFLIEFSDIIFAIDSVPAVFSISTHPFIVYTSNILAILGLRQLYFVLEYVADQFQYVRFGVGIILLFTGVKLLAVIFGIHFSTAFSILFIFSVLVISVLISVIVTKHQHSKKVADRS